MGGINALMDGGRQVDGWVAGEMVKEDVLMGWTGGRRGEGSI